MSKTIVFHATERCGLACVHCLRDPGKKPAELSLELVDRLLGEAKALHAVGHVGFTGGDPLLWPNLEGAIDAVVRHGFTWHLVSSGRRFDRFVALLDSVPARKERLTLVDLSLDAATERTHDAIRGSGSYREVMAAAASLSARETPFLLQMTVNALNEREIEEFGFLAGQLGAKKISFSMTNATGRPQDRDFYLSPAQLDRVVDRIDRLSSLLRIEISLAEGFRRRERLHMCAPFQTDVLHVTPHGMLNLCCSHSGIAGGADDVVADLATTSLADAHRRLVDLTHRMLRARLDDISDPNVSSDAWIEFPCNWCLSRLGKPHWVDGGGAGPLAVGPVIARD